MVMSSLSSAAQRQPLEKFPRGGDSGGRVGDQEVLVGGEALAGYVLFQNRQCASCHNVAGTPASGQVAPDLSHVASRRTIAAGRLPTSHDNIAAWIRDPQAVKPGNNMPKVPLSESELQAVTAYLETLK